MKHQKAKPDINSLSNYKFGLKILGAIVAVSMYFVIGNAQMAIAEPKTKCPCSLDRALLHIIQHRGDDYLVRVCETDTDSIGGTENTLRTRYSSEAEHSLRTEHITPDSYYCHVLVEEGSDTQDFQKISITEDQYYACTEDISLIGQIADNQGLLGDEENWFGCDLTP